MKTTKLLYWGTTGLLSALLLMSAGMYLFKNDDVAAMFELFGYPTYIIYPLAFAKITAVIVLWFPKLSRLKEWAYSALFFEFILAVFAHVMIEDGEQFGAIIAIILLLTSYFTYQKIQTNSK